MRTIKELLERIVPFVIIGLDDVGGRVPKHARDLYYLDDLWLDEFNYEEGLSDE